ncbi:MAG: zinc ribbon domain-containing protein [Candidatus Pacebacteria bacterium]|nr:zinc ribbon domain-containing protein [Candidatus Paceibacterota bacterium]
MNEIKKCPKCKEDIKFDAKKCKHCGADLRNWIERHKILTVLISMFFLITITNIFGNVDNSKIDSTNYSSQKTQIIKITATKLIEEYDENEVSAKQKYEGKFLQITGTIEDIGSDITGDPYIILNSRFGLSGVQCVFPKTQISNISKLKKGSEVTIIGKNIGNILNIVLKDCSF